MKKRISCALWVAFVTALGLGYGCNSSSYNNSAPPAQNLSLDGKSYTEKFTCNEIFVNPPLSCPDLNTTDVIAFQSTGGNAYTAHDVPDTGYLYTGTLVGSVFTWTATSAPADAYTENGTWTFSAYGDTFTGNSHYVANNASFSGDCNETGVLGTVNTPPDPPLPSGCP